MLTLSVPVLASDRLVINGGSSRPRAIAYQPRPLLDDQPSSVSDESLQPPLLSDNASVTICDEDDAVERENKRPRVDSYEIALAANDVPRTYAEAMARSGMVQDDPGSVLDNGVLPEYRDPCFFVRRECDGDDKSVVYVVLYVDDLLVGCTRDEDAEKVRDELSERFTLKSLGDSRFVLGMDVKHDMEKGELILKQEQFITKMLQKFGPRAHR
ncbi:hypothetical protein PsorP6_010673 [Peronosclerospora sorghi]|uniref:Uncharacterized protein n=1 Tax=Peronosclerospora sorghi TaxID=230839 RepID=A0ACC0VVC9_9STRA|nr:hypothetical protein PsorP6_010673 [Peronosclerospora sorghi]